MVVRKNGRPDPDPTVLTTAQLDRAIAGLREAMESQLTGTREVIEARLDGMDKAIELLQRSTDKIPTFVKAEVKQLQELHEEKFQSIATQFTERDARTEQTSRDSKIAIDAALQAAKEAVGKTEVSFTKQIDGIGALLQSMTKSFDDKFEDIKGRITSIEGYSKGVSGVWGFIVGGVGLLVGLGTLAIMIGRRVP